MQKHFRWHTCNLLCLEVMKCYHDCFIFGNLQVEQIYFVRACDNFCCTCIGSCLQNTHKLSFELWFFPKIVYFHYCDKCTNERDFMYNHDNLMPYLKKALKSFILLIYSCADIILFLFNHNDLLPLVPVSRKT